MDFVSIWDLLRYAKDQRMCTSFGCTTCGCMPFRELCHSVGFEKMSRLVASATEEELSNFDPNLWYEPLRLILFVLGDLPADTPMMKRYLAIRDALFAERERKRDAGRAKVLAEQEKARERRRRAEEHRERSKIKNELYRKQHENGGKQ